MNKEDKILSMVVIGRNDDYMEDYLYRLSNTLCFLASNLRELGRLDEMEVIVVDWGSDLPLRKALNLTEDAIAITRFASLSPQLVRECSPGVDFHSTRAVNVGLRRASGTYAMLADTDSLMPKYSLDTLLGLLERGGSDPIPLEKAYLHIRRYQIPWHLSVRQPSVQQWTRYCSTLAASLQAEETAVSASCLGGFAAAQLLHRDLWEELGGYDESLEATWGWCDNDLMIRLSKKYPSIDLSLYGVYSMHIEHLPKSGGRAAGKPKQPNPMKINYRFKVNGNEWGLADRQELVLEQAEISKEAIRHLDLDRPYSPLIPVFNAKANFDEPYSEDFHAKVATIVKDAVLPVEEWEDLFHLSWFSRCSKPVSFYWMGHLKIDCLLPVLAFSRGVDCYLMNIWEEGVAALEDENGPSNLSCELGRVGYKGYARIMLGEIGESIDCIQKDPLALPQVELAYLSADVGEFEFTNALEKTFRSLPVGGAIVIAQSGHGTEDGPKLSMGEWQGIRDNGSPMAIPFEVGDGSSIFEVKVKALLDRNKDATAFILSSGKNIVLTRSGSHIV